MEKIKSRAGKLQTESSPLSLVIAKALDKNLPLALWRLPGQEKSTLIVAGATVRLSKEDALEELPSGFIFAPYCEKDPPLFIEGTRFTIEDNMVAGAMHEIDRCGSCRDVACYVSTTDGNDDISPTGIDQTTTTNTGDPTSTDDRSRYQDLVRKSIEEIDNGRFEKVVPSRVKKVALPGHFDCINTYQRLCDDHREALISLVHIPGAGTWMGASPEVLVSVEEGRIFRTVALAGTQPYHEGTSIKSVAWTQKEIEEQALVERYIISCFKRIRLREYEEHGPKTVIAGKLMHLRSDFTVDMQATGFPQLGSVMLNLLHPTSAVCGMPFEPAREFLRKHEGYDRQFYTGYLGPVSVDGNTDLYVNLRCMRITESHAMMYAGAGVTADSVPEKEWEETEMKFNALSTSLT